MHYELAIIGGGPAGVGAGVYAARKLMPSIVITESFGGQSRVAADIENWIGTVSLSGKELANNLEEHLRAYAGDTITIQKPDRVTSVTTEADHFVLTTKSEKEYAARRVLVATGAHRRKLDVPGAGEFDNKGISYCASCDAPMFSGKDVAVIGGGNAGFDAARQLLAHAKHVTLLEYTDDFAADPASIQEVRENDAATLITNAEVTEVRGDTFVNQLVYRDRESGEEHSLDVEGIFVEIGLIPNTEFVADLVECDEHGRITIDPWTQRTSREGIWAAGDCTNIRYHQNNIAAGDGVKALEDIYQS